MEKAYQNRIALLVIGLFAIAPFVGFITLKTVGREFNVIISIISLFSIYYTFITKGHLNIPIYIKLWALFAFYTVISDIFIAKTSPGLINILFYNKYISCLYVVLIIENLKIPDDFFSKITLTTKVVLIIAFFVIIIQQFVSHSFFINFRSLEEARSNLEESRFPSIYSWIGPSAYMGLAYFPLLSVIICEALRQKSKYTWIFFLMGGVVAFLNKSRFMMLNFLMIFILIPIYEKVTFSTVIKGIIIIIGLSFAFYYGAKAVNYDVDKVINERILESDSRSLEKSSAGTRIIAFQVFTQLFPKNPFFGKGMLHSFGREGSKDIDLVRAIHGRSSQIHVGYLSLFYYYGLIGGGFFVIFLIYFFKKLYRDAKITGFWGVYIGWIMFFLTNWTAVTLSFINMGLIVSLFVNKYYLSKLYQNQQA